MRRELRPIPGEIRIQQGFGQRESPPKSCCLRPGCTQSQRTPNTRLIWRLDVTAYTNWHGLVLPAQFRYLRYTDANLRTEREELIPITDATGSLLKVYEGALTDIQPHLSNQLTVTDYRAKDQLDGQPARYVLEGKWSPIGSEDFRKMVATNKLRIAGADAPPTRPTRPKLYDPAADGSQQIAAALKAAAPEQKRLILKFGANW